MPEETNTNAVAEITPIKAIREFFNTPPVTMDEMKALTKEDKAELAALIVAETNRVAGAEVVKLVAAK
jgi:hypothetical protein